MALSDDTFQPSPAERTVSTLEAQLTRLLYVDAEILAYTVIFILSVITRFWDLGARAMSHDESLHVRYSWNLYKGQGFQHTPLMHGPLLFHMTALSYLLFGDNDYTGRIYAAIVGIIVVMLPIFFRRWLGRTGAVATSFLLLISPMIMYYSRYIREDMPAILGALMMVLGTWHYIEKREYKYLLILTLGFAILFSQKEVSFIYVAIFGSFLTLYWMLRLLDVEWKNQTLFRTFAASLVLVVIGLGTFGAVSVIERGEQAEFPTAEAIDPSQEAAAPTNQVRDIVKYAGMGVAGLGFALLVISVFIGQWSNLRRFPELDVAVVMGTLILPMLSPFVIHTLGHNSMDESPEGIRYSFMITLPILILSVVIGLIWGMQPPKRRTVQMPKQSASPDGDEISVQVAEVEVRPDLVDWAQALMASRWWAIGLIFWLWFFFFFTTMFTNGAGIGTGIIGSLGYWLEQQEVKRGNQPDYYYLLITPMYEFLPLILSFVAGFVGLNRLFRRKPAVQPAAVQVSSTDDEGSADQEVAELPPVRRRPFIDLDSPVKFPVFLFTAWWAVMNLAAYSIAGEKMPWLTTHITVPLIFLGGWVIGKLVDSIKWRKLALNRAWVVVILLPILAIALLRVAAPVCNLIALPQVIIEPGSPAPEYTLAQALLGSLRLPCNTIIPVQYQEAIFNSPTLTDLYATYEWIAAVLVLAGVIAGLVAFGRTLRFRQIVRLSAMWVVVYLVFLTTRTALIASFVNYDLATEYLVYAHSSGAVKEVMEQIDEISLKTTDGYGLRVAYDNRVSWPYSWYFRNYYNAVYYGDNPSRGLIGDAPVILAGPDNWPKVEAIIADRYYTFEYIRMWWPMQDYFDLKEQHVETFLVDPQMQRGIWNIFMYKDYTAYSEAVTKYRASTPNFELSSWPVSERMRVYIRKDVFAEVWDYGVTASEIAAATDPYAEGIRQIAPITSYGTGLLARPHGASRGDDGLIYIADSGNHRIVVMDAQGNVVRTLGSFGLAPQENALNEPWDVAVSPNGNVYIADTWNHRVVQYDADGEYVRSWGFEGPNLPDSDAFWGPRGIAVDGQGNVYVSDTGNKRISVFDGEGNYLRQIATGGVLDGQIDEPAGLAFGPDGLLYVADTWNQRIDVFTPDGGFVRSWPVDAWYAQTNERPYIAVDAAGRVYITDPDAFRVIVFNSLGQYLFSFGDSNLIGLAGGIVEGEDGQVYLIDTANGSVQLYPVESSAP